MQMHEGESLPRRHLGSLPRRHLTGSRRVKAWRNEAIMDLWARGFNSSEIARQLQDMVPATVRSVVRAARRKDDPRARVSRKHVAVYLNDWRWARLCRAAEMRNVTPTRLATLLIAFVAQDDLFDAVLGDLEELDDE